LVADGCSQPEVQKWSAEHIVLSRPHRDNGNTPRGLGSLSAMNQGFDAIAYLDADNWYYPAHIEAMVNLHSRTGAIVCTATRDMYHLNGCILYTDTFESDGNRHVDTSCLFLTRLAFDILPLWTMMPKQLGPMCDSVIWQALLGRRFSHAHCPEPTVAFRTRYQVHYREARQPAPPGAVTNAESTGQAKAWWRSLPADTRLKWQRYFIGSIKDEAVPPGIWPL
jgi:hypothetical protein